MPRQGVLYFFSEPFLIPRAQAYQWADEVNAEIRTDGKFLEDNKIEGAITKSGDFRVPSQNESAAWFFRRTWETHLNN